MKRYILNAEFLSPIIYCCHICTTRNFAGSRYLAKQATATWREAPTKKNHLRWMELIKKIRLLDKEGMFERQ